MVTIVRRATPGAAGLLSAPVATTIADLRLAASAINTTGKVEDKMVKDENGRRYFALGAAPNAAWRPWDDQSGLGNDIVPA